MNFKEWREIYHPNEDEETLYKMSHAWAAGHVNMVWNGRKEQSGVVDIIGSELRFHVENKGMTDKGEDYEKGFIDAIVHIHALLLDANNYNQVNHGSDL